MTGVGIQEGWKESVRVMEGETVHREERQKKRSTSDECLHANKGEQTKQKKEDKGVQAHEMQLGEKCVGEVYQDGSNEQWKTDD